jgi:hypothetical protein
MSRNLIQNKIISNLTQKIFPEGNIEILERPHSFIIKDKSEHSNKIKRIIILPPKGYTANSIDELNSHDEVRKAKITVKGSFRDGKENFSLIKKCLKFAFLPTRNAVTQSDVPYALISQNQKIYKEKILSSKESVYVVKENGEGFYHNLISLSDEWLVIVLDKELRSGKKMNIESKLGSLTLVEKRLVQKLMEKVHKYGDELFEKDKNLIGSALKIKTEKILPVLIESLNILETGRHEPCTVYALILNKSKSDKEKVIEYLKNASKNKDAPDYYLSELLSKIKK